jgi:hypothetical protein
MKFEFRTSSSPFPFFYNIIRRLAEGYFVWVGDSGYDTRPYCVLPNGQKVYAPVAYVVEFASRGREVEEFERGDIWGWLVTRPAGTLVVFPEYSGGRWRGDACFDSEGRTSFYLDAEESA